jgi:hypothetical protein
VIVIIACPCGLIFHGDREAVAEAHFRHVCPLDIDRDDEEVSHAAPGDDR